MRGVVYEAMYSEDVAATVIVDTFATTKKSGGRSWRRQNNYQEPSLQRYEDARKSEAIGYMKARHG